jgi:hypothetical protein
MERHVGQVLHGEEVVSLVFSDAIDFDDIGVIEALTGLGFPVKALELPSIRSKVRTQHLEGDEAFSILGLGLVDHGHPSLAKFIDKLVGAKSFSNQLFNRRGSVQDFTSAKRDKRISSWEAPGKARKAAKKRGDTGV